MGKPAVLNNPFVNRVIGSGEESPEQLLANPANFRIHPDFQQQSLAGSIDSIGYIDPVLVNKRTGMVIDGHLRVALALRSNVKMIPVTYVDLSEDEEKLALLSLDPIAAMAASDRSKLDELLHQVNSDDERVQQMLAEIAEREGLQFGGNGNEPGENIAHKTLAERFGVPPFSVLDARQGYWQARKNAWISLGIKSEIGRGDNGGYPHGPTVTQNDDGTLCDSKASRDGWLDKVAPGGSPRDAASLGKNGKTQRGDGKGRPLGAIPPNEKGDNGILASPGKYASDNNGLLGNSKQARSHYRKEEGWFDTGLTFASGTPRRDEVSQKLQEQTGTSIFDPVLCELAYRWFIPPGNSRIIDPFAGGSVRGIVASSLGYDYTGIDLRPEQIAANEAQAAEIVPDKMPRWIVGDSQNVNTLAPGEYDFIFSCPPYFDLELYSDDQRDLSNAGDYPAFSEVYRRIIAACVDMLKDNRFACFVVGDIRDKRGFYRNFPADTISAFQDAGMTLYNDAVLVTAVGSLPIRVGKQFGGYRKLGKTHQNVLVFYKGDPKIIKNWGEPEFGELESANEIPD